MKTGIEMYEYCKTNKYGSGSSESWSIKHFGVVESLLQKDETVLMCFMGLHNYISNTQHENNFAYAITDKRILFGQKKLMGESSKSVYLNTLNDISYNSGMLFGIITIDTLKEKFNVAMDKTQGKNTFEKIQEILSNLNSKQNVAAIDPTSELRKYKQLMDDGIISLDDFEKKKKELLGL